jgi:hypothetical protein
LRNIALDDFDSQITNPTPCRSSPLSTILFACSGVTCDNRKP